MKNIIVLAAILFSFITCKKTDTPFANNSIVGKWRLSEQLMDPGDGSGTWHEVDQANSVYFEFKADGALKISPDSAGIHLDRYELTSDSTLTFHSGTQEFHRSYYFSKTLLTITGGCYEACGQRFVPVP